MRLLFDRPATATPEPLGQGLKPGAFLEGLDELAAAGVKVASSGLAFPPLDNPVKVTDPEYRDRLEVQSAYVQRALLTLAAPIVPNPARPMTAAEFIKGAKRLLGEIYSDVKDWGSAGLGTPTLLGGCRDHTKLVIIDGTVAFCGGANAHRYYLYDNPISPTQDATDEMNAASTEKWLKWHDCFIRYEGPAVRSAQRYFAERWAVCTGKYLSRDSADYFPPPTPVGNASIKVVCNIPGLERDIEGEYLRMFRNSTQRIQIENPYVTDDLIGTYLAHAAKVRNIPVDLLVPEKYLDFAIARDLMKARWDSLRDAGIALYTYNSHMLHVKVATADGHVSIVGSYNFAKSSAASLFEHGVVVDDAAFAAEVQQKLFDVDQPASTRVTTNAAPDWVEAGKSKLRIIDRMVLWAISRTSPSAWHPAC